MNKSLQLSAMAVFMVADRAFLPRAGVWATVGVLYGFIFTSLHVLAPLDGLGAIAAALLPAVLTAVLGAAVYGSMRLTVIVSIYAAIGVVVCFLAMGRPAQLEYLLLAGGLVGATVGGVYGWRVPSSRVFRADAKLLAGAAAGVIACSALFVPLALGIELPLSLQALILCPLSGLLYIGIAPTFVRRFSDLLPPVGDGMLVGLGGGLLMGLMFWVMAGSLEGYLSGPDQQVVDVLLTALPMVTLAAVVGALLAALGRSLLGVSWYDL